MAADDRIERLYAAPPEEFVEARDRLARELRQAGEADAAAEVKRRRRPTVAAWAVNRLARRHAGEVEELLSSGEDLRKAQERALSGREAEELQRATARRRDAVDGPVDRAEELLREDGRSTSRATLDRVAETLLATAVDEVAAQRVRRGTLEREVESPAGFAGILPEATAAPHTRERPAGPERRARERAERLAEAAREAEKDAEEAERRARDLERESERAARRAERSRRAAEGAGDRARELRRKAEEARRRLERRR